jgi:hypothetical protein
LKTIIVILMILLLARTSVSQDFVKAENPIVKLKKKDLAPFDGVLLNETDFRFYIQQADNAFLLEGHVKELQKELQTCSACAPWVPIMWTVIGGSLTYTFMSLRK